LQDATLLIQRWGTNKLQDATLNGALNKNDFGKSQYHGAHTCVCGHELGREDAAIKNGSRLVARLNFQDGKHKMVARRNYKDIER
jgi:hypothetical protein